MAGPPPLQCQVLWMCLIPARRPQTGRWPGSPPPSRRTASRSRPYRLSSPLAGRSRRSDRRLENTIMILDHKLCCEIDSYTNGLITFYGIDYNAT